MSSSGDPKNATSKNPNEANTHHDNEPPFNEQRDSSPGSLQNSSDLKSIAKLANNGDEASIQHAFASLGAGAWGLAYCVTSNKEQSARAVAEGMQDAMREHHAFRSDDDVRECVLTHVRQHAQAFVNSGVVTITPRNGAQDLHGEASDPQAARALASLNENDRAALWLIGVERLTPERAGHVLDKAPDDVDDLADETRNTFRKRYLEATDRTNLNDECKLALDRLGAYVDRSLPTDEVAATELHLVHCAHCRGVVLRLSDDATRVRAAIPPVPVSLHQCVLDTFAGVATVAPFASAAVASSDTSTNNGNTTTRRAAWLLPAMAVLSGLALVGAVLAGAIALNHNNNERLARSTTTSIADNDNQGSGATTPPSAPSPTSSPSPTSPTSSTSLPTSHTPPSASPPLIKPKTPLSTPSSSPPSTTPATSPSIEHKTQDRSDATNPISQRNDTARSDAADNDATDGRSTVARVVTVITTVTTETITETITTTRKICRAET